MFRKNHIAATLLVLSTCPASATDFNASIWFPDSHPLTRYGYIEWAETLSEVSEGDLNANVFTGTVLLPPAAHLSGLRDGVADLTYHAGTYTAKDLPVDNLIAQLMFNYSDYFVTAFAYTDFAMTDPASLAQFESNGIVFGGGYATPPYLLFCREEITSLADIKGKKLKLAVTNAAATWAESVEAVNISAPSSEMYSGLDKGQIDCASNAGNDLKSRSLWDVAKHTTMVDLGMYWAGWEYAYNADFWASLTDNQRRILLDTMSDAIVNTGLNYIIDAEQALDEASDHDVTIHQPEEDLVDSINKHQIRVRDQAVNYGEETLGIENSEEIIKRFEATYAKWDELLKDVPRDSAKQLKAVLRQNLYDKIDESSYGLY